MFSFEFFPPKTDDGERNLHATLHELRALEPDYVSVTYGAGGSTRDRTVEITKHIKDEHGLEAMAHLSCVGTTEARAARDPRRGPRRGHRQRARAARRSAARRDGVEADPRRIALLDRARGADPRQLRLLHRRGVLPRGPSRGARPRPRPEVPQGEGRRGRDLPDHPAVLRQPPLLRLRRGGARRRHRRCRSSRGSSRSPTSSRSSASRPCAGPRSPVRCCASWSCAPTIPRRSPSSGSPTPRCSAPTCSRGARPGIHFYTLNRSPATRAIVSALKTLRPWAAQSGAVTVALDAPG